MRKTRLRISSLFLALLLVGFFPPLGADVFTFSGNRVRSVFTKGKERTLLTGNARITSDANNIRADEIELYGEDLVYAECRGAVHLVNLERGLELTSDQLFYDRNRKVAQVRGNAVMVDRKNEVVVKGGYIENHEDDDVTIIQIGVRILKENMTCRSEYAKYLRQVDTLELTGMPVVYWKGDRYEAQKITIDLKKDEVKLEGNVAGQVNTEKKEEATPAPTETPSPTASPTASPAPTSSPALTASPLPSASPSPSTTPGPDKTPAPSPSAKPRVSP
jgi:lipopolysaccharide export system protein LptA